MTLRPAWLIAAAGVVGVGAALILVWVADDGRVDADGIVMLGDSITEQGDWQALLPHRSVVNAGRSGYTTAQLVPVAREVAAAKPAIVFVLTGTNDIRDGHPPTWTADRLHELLDAIEAGSPTTTIVVQTILPRDDRPHDALATAEAVRAVAESRGLRVLDLHSPFDDGTGGLRDGETTDGVHLSEAGYMRWAELLRSVLDES